MPGRQMTRWQQQQLALGAVADLQDVCRSLELQGHAIAALLADSGSEARAETENVRREVVERIHDLEQALQKVQSKMQRRQPATAAGTIVEQVENDLALAPTPAPRMVPVIEQPSDGRTLPRVATGPGSKRKRKSTQEDADLSAKGDMILYKLDGQWEQAEVLRVHKQREARRKGRDEGRSKCLDVKAKEASFHRISIFAVFILILFFSGLFRGF